jgi:MYXO-CTERM domain-containing protein
MRRHALALASLALVAASPARATVTEPNGLTVPQPVTPTEIQSAKDQNKLYPLITLDALFQSRADAIDWQADAQKKPDTFSPVCGFTAELVLRGGGCQIDFGWYNVTGTAPTDAQIYPLITAAQIAALPLMSMMPGAGQDGPTFNANTILTNANYKGGLIGFATKGNPTTNCTQTHYSQQDFNVLCTDPSCKAADGNNHWVASIIYKSVIDPNGYYIAFEDLPMSATSFSPPVPGKMFMNDGDLNDFVFFVTGVTCPGGGKACQTTKQGVCKDGINQCVSGGALVCQQVVQPSAEKCDGLDNDCNGMVDDGDGLCPVGFSCIRGVCTGPCGDLEFPCGGGLVCDNGLCVESSCVGVTCPAGQVCHGGTCRGPCDGIVCPIGQVCRVGRCADPCAGVSCSADSVCRNGVCVQKCQCLACDTGFACEMSTGRCVSSGCENMTCAAGQVCDKGACTDPCQGAVCPTGQQCMAGNCMDAPGSPTTTGQGGSAGGGKGGSGGGGTTTGKGGAAGTSPTTGAGGDSGAADAGAPIERGTPPSCRCDVDPGSPGPAAVALALLAAAALRVRPRSSGGRLRRR